MQSSLLVLLLVLRLIQVDLEFTVIIQPEGSFAFANLILGKSSLYALADLTAERIF